MPRRQARTRNSNEWELVRKDDLLRTDRIMFLARDGDPELGAAFVEWVTDPVLLRQFVAQGGFLATDPSQMGRWPASTQVWRRTDA